MSSGSDVKLETQEDTKPRTEVDVVNRVSLTYSVGGR
jgi:hypothetical protein